MGTMPWLRSSLWTSMQRSFVTNRPSGRGDMFLNSVTAFSAAARRTFQTAFTVQADENGLITAAGIRWEKGVFQGLTVIRFP